MLCKRIFNRNKAHCIQLIETKHIVYNQAFDKKIRLLKPDRNYRPLIWILDLSKMSQEIS